MLRQKVEKKREKVTWKSRPSLGGEDLRSNEITAPCRKKRVKGKGERWGKQEKNEGNAKLAPDKQRSRGKQGGHVKETRSREGDRLDLKETRGRK